jgi:hypothetical protein
MIKDSDGKVRFYGVYRGVVADTRDPLAKNRIRVQVPQVLSDQVTGWAWPISSPSNTQVVVPAVGDGVFIMFEGGDPSFPLWSGKFSGEVAATPDPVAVRWSPVFEATGLTFTGSGATYPTYNSYYIKHGQLVSFNIKIDMNTVTNFGTGQFKTALPFAPISSAANHFSAWSWVDPSQSADELNGHKQLIADHLPGSISLDLHWLKETTANPKPLIESPLVQGTPVTFTTASKMYINGTYIAAG